MNRSLLLLGLCLVGCQATQNLAKETEEARSKFAKNAEKELSQKLPADANKRFEAALQAGKEAVATINHAKEVLVGILESHDLTPTDRVWIEKQLQEGGPAVQQAMQPLLVEAHKHVPDAREWAIAQAQRTFGKTKDKIWSETLQAMDQVKTGK